MRILFERNIATKYITAFKSETWAELGRCDNHFPPYATDESIAQFASEHDYVVFTTDTDFFNVSPDCGVLYFDQNENPNPGTVVDAVKNICEAYQNHSNIMESVTGHWI